MGEIIRLPIEGRRITERASAQAVQPDAAVKIILRCVYKDAPADELVRRARRKADEKCTDTIRSWTISTMA